MGHWTHSDTPRSQARLTGQEVGVWRVSEECKGSQPEVVPGRCFTPPCSYPTMFLPEGVPLPQCHMTQHKLYGELEGIHISSTYEEALSTRAGWKWEQLPWSRMCFPCVRNLLSSVGGGSVADRWRTSCSFGVYSVAHRWNISPSSRHLTAVPFPFGGALFSSVVLLDFSRNWFCEQYREMGSLWHSQACICCWSLSIFTLPIREEGNCYVSICLLVYSAHFLELRLGRHGLHAFTAML